ncbi:elicitor peptide 6 [Salvia divinorum]|uniref:Elicitor peptide 6 n=1 Tax=Salvia divinorum TaxID=28513 RepID=A0ABD1G8T8_SALDI
MEVKSVEKKCNEDYFFLQSPCIYFQEFTRAVLSCLGFNSDGGGSSLGQMTEEESSSAADPLLDLAALVRVPPRPVISSGGGPQTNTNPN